MAITVRFGSQQISVQPGERCPIGRGGSDEEQAVWLRLGTAPGLSRVAVVVSCVDETLWTLERPKERNGVKVLDYRTGSVLRLAHGQVTPMPSTFTDVMVVVVTDTREYEFNVIEGDHGVPGVPLGGNTDDATVTRVKANASFGYFRALVALCEPKLRDRFNDRLPSESEVCRRLVESGLDAEDLTPKAIEKRFEYLRRTLEVSDNRALRDRAVDSECVSVANLAIFGGRLP